MVTTDQRPGQPGRGPTPLPSWMWLVPVAVLAVAETLVVLAAATRSLPFLVAGLTLAGGFVFGLAVVLLWRHNRRR